MYRRFFRIAGATFLVSAALTAAGAASDSEVVKNQVNQVLNISAVDSISVHDFYQAATAKKAPSRAGSEKPLDKVCVVQARTVNGGHMTTTLEFMPSKNDDVIRINDKKGDYSNLLNERFVVQGWLQTRPKKFMRADFPDLVIIAHREPTDLQVCKGAGCTIEAGTKTPFGKSLPGFGHNATIDDHGILAGFNSMIRNFTKACAAKLVEEESPENTARELYTQTPAASPQQPH